MIGTALSCLAVSCACTLAIAQPANVIFVDSNQSLPGPRDGSTWATAYETLQAALEDERLLAPGWRQIWVANGVYRPSVPFCLDCDTPGARHATFRIPSGVKIYGGFTGIDHLGNDPNDPNTGPMTLNERIEDEEGNHLTILSGDLNQSGDTDDEDAYHVVTAVDVSRFTKLSGFRIEHGNADSTDPNQPLQRVGGGILIIGTRIEGFDIQSSPIVTRCQFRDNVARRAGAGIFATWTRVPDEPNDPNCIDDPDDEVVLRPVHVVNCEFTNNLLIDKTQLEPTHTGGAIAVFGAAMTLTNNVFYSNEADNRGGAVEFTTRRDPLADWPRCASSDDVLAWWNAGMPPIEGGNEQ